MNPLFHTEFSISDSLKNVRKSVLIYETIILDTIMHWEEYRRNKESIIRQLNYTKLQFLIEEDIFHLIGSWQSAIF